jgi:ADP-ribosylglycohydrolase
MSEEGIKRKDRILRARLSLDGLSVGDAFGERFFGDPDKVAGLIAQRVLPRSPWRYTDDTVMALAIVEVLKRCGRIDCDLLAGVFARKFFADPTRGYGGMARRILQEIAQGRNWREVTSAAFNGMGSMGNGGAMRAAPIGAYFSDDFQQAAGQACFAAQVTHAHPEGQAGAAAVAVAAAFACSGGAGKDLLDTAIAFTPDSDTQSGLRKARDLTRDIDVSTAVRVLGNGSRVISQDTVPFALWCASRHLECYEEALWTTVAGLGDRDTTCAIVGGIVVLKGGATSIPSAWLEARESLGQLAGVGLDGG